MRSDGLKRLLDTYRDAGVTEVEFDDKLQPKRLKFAPPGLPVPTGEVEGAEADWTSGAPMDLAKAVAQIQKAYAPKQPKGQAQ